MCLLTKGHLRGGCGENTRCYTTSHVDNAAEEGKYGGEMATEKAVNHEMIHEVMLVGLVWSFGVFFGSFVLLCSFVNALYKPLFLKVLHN